MGLLGTDIADATLEAPGARLEDLPRCIGFIGNVIPGPAFWGGATANAVGDNNTGGPPGTMRPGPTDTGAATTTVAAGVARAAVWVPPIGDGTATPPNVPRFGVG